MAARTSVSRVARTSASRAAHSQVEAQRSLVDTLASKAAPHNQVDTLASKAAHSQVAAAHSQVGTSASRAAPRKLVEARSPAGSPEPLAPHSPPAEERTSASRAAPHILVEGARTQARFQLALRVAPHSSPVVAKRAGSLGRKVEGHSPLAAL